MSPRGSLQLEGVSKRYGSNMALDDVSLDVARSAIHAVIGPNGAGKSTLFGVIAGEHVPEFGRILLNGHDIGGLRPHQCVSRGVGRTFQVARVFTSLSVEDNIRMARVARSGRQFGLLRSARRRCPKTQCLSDLDRVGLSDVPDAQAGVLAQGDKKRLEIGMALVKGATLLLLDEPTAGMSPEETTSTAGLIRQLQESEGVTILVSEHKLQFIYGIASAVTVLHRGRVLTNGSPDEIRRSADVREVYLGGE